MLGISDDHKAYRLWDVEKKQIFHSRDVVCNDSNETSKQMVVLPVPSPLHGSVVSDYEPEIIDTLESIQTPRSASLTDTDDSSQGQDELEEPNLRQNISNDPIQLPEGRSKRKRRLSSKFEDMYKYYVEHSNERVCEDEPLSYKNAMQSPEAEKWREAIRAECDAIQRNETWTEEDPQEGANIVEAKWVFKRKYDVQKTSLHRARCVAKGFTQVQGQDYDQTYSPVVRVTSLRILFAITPFYKFTIVQL